MDIHDLPIELRFLISLVVFLPFALFFGWLFGDGIFGEGLE